jgi:hypothetical protein
MYPIRGADSHGIPSTRRTPGAQHPLARRLARALEPSTLPSYPARRRLLKAIAAALAAVDLARLKDGQP